MEGKIFGVPLVLIVLLFVIFCLNFIPMVLLHNATQQTLRSMHKDLSQEIIKLHSVPKPTEFLCKPTVNEEPDKVVPSETSQATPSLVPRQPIPKHGGGI